MTIQIKMASMGHLIQLTCQWANEYLQPFKSMDCSILVKSSNNYSTSDNNPETCFG